MKIIIDIHCKRPIFQVSSILIEFDIFIYVLIFLMIFGHKMDTN